MKLLMTISIILIWLQPLHYGIQSLIRLSRQRRTLYPLLRIQHSQGIQSLITLEAKMGRIPASIFLSSITH